MVRLYLDTRRHASLQLVFKAFFDFLFIALQSRMTPAQCLRTCHGHADESVQLAIRIEAEFRDAIDLGVFVRQSRGGCYQGSVVCLPDPARPGMFPVQLPNSQYRCPGSKYNSLPPIETIASSSSSWSQSM